MTPFIISVVSIHVLACLCLIAILLLFGVSALVAVPVSIALTLLGGFGYKKWRKSVELRLAKSVNDILAIKGVKAASRRDCVYWPGKEALSVVVDKSNNSVHFIDYRYFGGIKNYYSYDISKLGCIAPYVSFDLKKRSDEEKTPQKRGKKKLLAIEIREKNPDQPGGMRDIQLYPIDRMRLFTVPYKREDDDMFVFATHAAAMAMEAITDYCSAAIK